MTTVATGQVLLAGTSPAGLAASFAALHVVSQRARVLRLRRTGSPLAINVVAVLPSSYSEWSRHPDLRAFRSSIAPPTDASVYASRNTSRCSLQDSRSGWIRYFLSCRALASPTTCRFIPALSGLPVIRQQSIKDLPTRPGTKAEALDAGSTHPLRRPPTALADQAHRFCIYELFEMKLFTPPKWSHVSILMHPLNFIPWVEYFPE
jgi:hypothetical protein